MDYRRRYILMKLSENLTDEERRFLVGQDREVMNKLDEIKRGQSFGRDFASNIAGNAVFDGAVWILRKLMKR